MASSLLQFNQTLLVVAVVVVAQRARPSQTTTTITASHKIRTSNDGTVST